MISMNAEKQTMIGCQSETGAKGQSKTGAKAKQQTSSLTLAPTTLDAKVRRVPNNEPNCIRTIWENIVI
uniref:Uncharacterized protein n=1 Tax=Romanomermis culicivorax TaxID=13658 RepID=A0A915IQ57_ROMCU